MHHMFLLFKVSARIRRKVIVCLNLYKGIVHARNTSLFTNKY